MARVVAVGLLFMGGFVARSPVAAQEPGGPHLGLPQVLEAGAEGPLLLLLHCTGCGAESWARFMEANKTRFRMVAPTLPGYAGSPRPGLPLWTDKPVFQDNAVEQLSTLIDERGLRDITVVGQSFGSTIAVRLAGRRPDVVSAVVNVDGFPPLGPPYNGLSLADRAAEARSIVDEDWALRLQDPAQWRSFNAANAQPDEASRKLHHGMFMATDRVSMVHYWRENFFADNDGFRGLQVPYLDIKAIPARRANPDSILAAHRESLDETGRPADFQEVVYHQTSHWIHEERPTTLGTTILSFIQGGPPKDVGPFRMGHVEEVGTGSRDVILMPCLGCDWRSWDELMARNADRYRMLAVTWPGLGDTPLPEVLADPDGTPYFDFLAEALRHLIRDRQLDRPVIVGHSAAAVLAVRFAAEHPDLVGGVVNVDAIVANGDTYGYSPEERLEWANHEMDAVLAQHDSPDAWRELNSRPTWPDTARARFYEDMWRTPPREHVFAYWKDWLRTDTGVLLPTVQVPFLAVHALSSDESRAREKRMDLEERYRRAPLPPGSRVVYIEDSGHTIWEHQPELLDAVLAEFILGTAQDLRRARGS